MRYSEFEKVLFCELNSKRANMKRLLRAFTEIRNNNNTKHIIAFTRKFLYSYFTEANLFDENRNIKHSAIRKVTHLIEKLKENDIIYENKSLKAFFFV